MSGARSGSASRLSLRTVNGIDDFVSRGGCFSFLALPRPWLTASDTVQLDDSYWSNPSMSGVLLTKCMYTAFRIAALHGSLADLPCAAKPKGKYEPKRLTIQRGYVFMYGDRRTCLPRLTFCWPAG